MTTTTLFFVRHAESVYTPGQERERGLSDQGEWDALKIAELLQHESIDVFLSSPYERAIRTIQPLADRLCKPIEQIEALRERAAGDFGSLSFAEAKRRLYSDFGLAFPGGESGDAAQQRVMEALEPILKRYAGRRIVIGTHGDIMTLLLNRWNPAYGYSFWASTSMPDIYRLELEAEGAAAPQVTRIWIP